MALDPDVLDFGARARAGARSTGDPRSLWRQITDSGNPKVIAPALWNVGVQGLQTVGDFRPVATEVSGGGLRLVSPLLETSAQIGAAIGEGDTRYMTRAPLARDITSSMNRTGGRLVQLGAVPFGDIGLGDTEYAQAVREGRIVEMLMEDVGNAALGGMAAGGVLRGIGRGASAAGMRRAIASGDAAQMRTLPSGGPPVAMTPSGVVAPAVRTSRGVRTLGPGGARLRSVGAGFERAANRVQAIANAGDIAGMGPAGLWFVPGGVARLALRGTVPGRWGASGTGRGLWADARQNFGTPGGASAGALSGAIAGGAVAGPFGAVGGALLGGGLGGAALRGPGVGTRNLWANMGRRPGPGYVRSSVGETQVFGDRGRMAATGLAGAGIGSLAGPFGALAGGAIGALSRSPSVRAGAQRLGDKLLLTARTAEMRNVDLYYQRLRAKLTHDEVGTIRSQVERRLPNPVDQEAFLAWMAGIPDVIPDQVRANLDTFADSAGVTPDALLDVIVDDLRATTSFDITPEGVRRAMELRENLGSVRAAATDAVPALDGVRGDVADSPYAPFLEARRAWEDKVDAPRVQRYLDGEGEVRTLSDAELETRRENVESTELLTVARRNAEERYAGLLEQARARREDAAARMSSAEARRVLTPEEYAEWSTNPERFRRTARDRARFVAGRILGGEVSIDSRVLTEGGGEGVAASARGRELAAEALDISPERLGRMSDELLSERLISGLLQARTSNNPTMAALVDSLRRDGVVLPYIGEAPLLPQLRSFERAVRADQTMEMLARDVTRRGRRRASAERRLASATERAETVPRPTSTRAVERASRAAQAATRRWQTAKTRARTQAFEAAERIRARIAKDLDESWVDDPTLFEGTAEQRTAAARAEVEGIRAQAHAEGIEYLDEIVASAGEDVLRALSDEGLTGRPKPGQPGFEEFVDFMRDAGVEPDARGVYQIHIDGKPVFKAQAARRGPNGELIPAGSLEDAGVYQPGPTRDRIAGQIRRYNDAKALRAEWPSRKAFVDGTHDLTAAELTAAGVFRYAEDADLILGPVDDAVAFNLELMGDMVDMPTKSDVMWQRYTDEMAYVVSAYDYDNVGMNRRRADSAYSGLTRDQQAVYRALDATDEAFLAELRAYNADVAVDARRAELEGRIRAREGRAQARGRAIGDAEGVIAEIDKANARARRDAEAVFADKPMNMRAGADDAASRLYGRTARQARKITQRELEFRQAERQFAKAETELARLEETAQLYLERKLAEVEAMPSRFRQAAAFSRALSSSLRTLADEMEAPLRSMPGADEQAVRAAVAPLRVAAGEVPVTLAQIADRVDPMFVPGGKVRPRTPGQSAGGSQMPPNRRATRATKRKRGEVTPMSAIGQAVLLASDLKTRVQNMAARTISEKFGADPRVHLARDVLYPDGRTPLAGRDLIDAMNEWGESTQGYGYVAWAPDSPFTVATEGQVTLNAIANGSVVFIPEPAFSSYSGSWKNPGTLERIVQDYFDRPTRVWKDFVLALSVTWHTGNLIGGMMLATIGAGENPLNVLTNLAEAKRMLDKGLEPQELWNIGINPEDLRYVRLADVVDEGRGTLRRGDLRPESRYRRALNASYRFNEKVDSMFRVATYIAKKKRGYSDAQAVAMAIQALPDFNLRWWEHRILRRIVPFYAWQKFVTQAAWRLPRDHPMRVLWTLHLANLYQPDDMASDVPFLAGMYPLGGGLFLPIGNFNPYAENVAWNPLDIGRSVNPLLKLGMESFTGISPDRLDALSAPVGLGRPDAYGGERPNPPIMRALGGDPMPLLYRASRLTRPTRALADATLWGGGIQRYDTGDPVRLSERIPGTQTYVRREIRRPPQRLAGSTALARAAGVVGIPVPVPVDVADLRRTRDERARRLASSRESYLRGG